jgi:serine/threonine protein kinase
MLQENREAFHVARAQLETWRAARFNQDAYLKSRREADEIWRHLGISQPQDKKLSKYGIRKARSPERKSAKYVASIEDGAVLGNYQFIEMIGIGGFGEVYRAKGIQVSREVAIKLYHIDNETVLDAFRQGANFLSQLNHTNIIILYDFFVFDAYALMVMELLNPHHTLRKFTGDFNSEERIPNFISIFSSLLSAIRYCHQTTFQGLDGKFKTGIYHGDIKPDNIFIQKRQIKVADFMIPNLETFLSRCKEDEDFPQYDTSRYGTPMYMSPEQCGGVVNEQTDIYNIGITAFELLTGFYPYETKYDYYAGKYQLPERFNPYSPPWLNAIIIKCMENDPTLRYSHISEIERDLIAGISESHPANELSARFYGPTVFVNRPSNNLRLENFQNTESGEEAKDQ